MKRMLYLLAAVATLASAGAARCQDGWKGTSGMLHLERAGTVGRGMLVFSLGTSYYKSDALLSSSALGLAGSVDWTEADVDYHFFLSRASLTFGLSDYVEFSAALGVRNWIRQVPDDFAETDVFETRTHGGIGDTDLLL